MNLAVTAGRSSGPKASIPQGRRQGMGLSFSSRPIRESESYRPQRTRINSFARSAFCRRSSMSGTVSNATESGVMPPIPSPPRSVRYRPRLTRRFSSPFDDREESLKLPVSFLVFARQPPELGVLILNAHRFHRTPGLAADDHSLGGFRRVTASGSRPGNQSWATNSRAP